MVNALKSEQTLMQEKFFGDGGFVKCISVSVYKIDTHLRRQSSIHISVSEWSTP